MEVGFAFQLGFYVLALASIVAAPALLRRPSSEERRRSWPKTLAYTALALQGLVVVIGLVVLPGLLRGDGWIINALPVAISAIVAHRFLKRAD